MNGSENNSCEQRAAGAQKKNSVTITYLPKRSPIDIAFNDITYSVSEGCKKELKEILKGVNGKFRSGEITAIMGPSGAGKSTLMDILAAYKTSNLSGTIEINGKLRILRNFRKLSCYIMQDDRLMAYLSVKEAMMVSANLKLGKDTKISTKKTLVKEILEALGLIESINTKTLNLSGGQRKRLSIALELVNNPPVMFFDEPTSGLDSSSCFQLISLLSALSRGRRTIVCTIHQPSARLFEMFDHLYMLAEGQCIYEGRVGGLVPFLGSLGYECPSYHNPADYVMEVVSGDRSGAVNKLVMAVSSGKCKNYNNSIADESQVVLRVAEIEATKATSKDEPNTTTADETSKVKKIVHLANDETVIKTPKNDISVPKAKSSGCTISFLDSNVSVASATSRQSGFPISEYAQFWILLKRAFLTIIRDRQLTHLRLISHFIVGALIGMIYYDIGNEASQVMSNAGCLYFTTLFTMFTAMMPTILTFPMEMAVFTREHLNYWYSLKAFYFAKTLADLPFQILFSSVYVIVVYYLTSQPFDHLRAYMFVTIFILTSLVAQSLGLLIGAGLSLESGVFLGPVSAIPTILFSGFLVNFETIPRYLKWLTYISYMRYSFEGAMLSVYGMDRKNLKCSQENCQFESPKKFLKEMSMDQSTYWHDAVALIGIFIGLRIIAYFVLRWKVHSIR